jgi:hypothetical protein
LLLLFDRQYSISQIRNPWLAILDELDRKDFDRSTIFCSRWQEWRRLPVEPDSSTVGSGKTGEVALIKVLAWKNLMVRYSGNGWLMKRNLPHAVDERERSELKDRKSTTDPHSQNLRLHDSVSKGLLN